MTMTLIPDREYFTPEQAAEVFQLTSDYVLRQGVRDRRFPHVRIGRAIRFSRAHIKEIAKLLEKKAESDVPAPRARRTATEEDVAGLRLSSRSARRHGGNG